MVAVEAILICVFLLLAEVRYGHDEDCVNLVQLGFEMLYGSLY